MTNISLIPATLALLDAEDGSVSDLCAKIGAQEPPSWPPEHHGPETREWLRGSLRQHPEETAFVSYYILADGCLAGICGFKGPPNADQVEIGYSVVPELHRRGIASAAVLALLDIARRDARVARVRGETLPSLVGSIAVLLRTGFQLVGQRTEPEIGEVVTYEIERPHF